MIVNEQKPLEFLNKCGAIFDQELLEKAILWRSDKPVQRLKTVYMHGRYPAVSIYKEKVHIHRLIVCYLNETWLPFEMHVDHINRNKLDARVSNLRVLTAKEHLSITHKGVPKSPEHRAKLIESNKRRKGMKYKVYENPELLNTEDTTNDK